MFSYTTLECSCHLRQIVFALVLSATPKRMEPIRIRGIDDGKVTELLSHPQQRMQRKGVMANGQQGLARLNNPIDQSPWEGIEFCKLCASRSDQKESRMVNTTTFAS